LYVGGANHISVEDVHLLDENEHFKGYIIFDGKQGKFDLIDNLDELDNEKRPLFKKNRFQCEFNHTCGVYGELEDWLVK